MSKNKQRIEAIIQACDEGRIHFQGGYPSQWLIENGRVYWASLDHDGAPELIVAEESQFIADYNWVFEEAE